MELRVLQYFLAIAREESISKAAQYLHISQPTLSRQIKEMEDELGTVLFIRGSRKITLTEEGMLLRQRAEEILSLVDKTEADLLSRESNLNGSIYIGCGETEGMSDIAQTIKTVVSKHPDVQFHLHSGNAQDILDRLEKGLIDFGILIGNHDVSSYHALKLPSHDITGVLMKKDHPLANKNVITLEDLRPYPLIVSRQDLAAKLLPDFLTDQKQFHIVATYNLIYNASLMVKADIGIALGLDKLIDTDHGDLCFRPLLPTIQTEIFFIWKKYHQFNKAAQYFLKTLRQQLKK